MVLIYLPDGTNIYSPRGVEFQGIGSMHAVDSCQIVFLVGALTVHCSYTFAVGCIV